MPRFGTIKKILTHRLIRAGLMRKSIFSVNGRKIVLTNLRESSILRQIALDGFESYENELVLLIKNYPWKLDAFFDIGANFGFYSILAETVFPRGMKIVAAEPLPENIAYIKKIKSLNRFEFELVEKAIDRSEGQTKTFYIPTAKSSSKLAPSASLINSFQGTGGIFNQLPYRTAEVGTTTLEALVSHQDGSCLIKLDCEGNELSILESSPSILRRDNVDFIIEIMINDSDKDAVFSIMRASGYDGYLITNAGLVREERPLTFPYPNRKNRTIWKNHFFTKKPVREIQNLSERCYGYWI